MIQAEIGEDNRSSTSPASSARRWVPARRCAARSARRPTRARSRRRSSPTTRGAILVAAVFDAFFTVYINRTRDLVRIAYRTGAPSCRTSCTPTSPTDSPTRRPRRRAHPEHLPARARLLPAGRHDVRRLPARPRHRRPRRRVRRRHGLPRRADQRLPRPRHPARGRHLLQRGRVGLGAVHGSGLGPSVRTSARLWRDLNRLRGRARIARTRSSSTSGCGARRNGSAPSSAWHRRSPCRRSRFIRCTGCGPTARCSARSSPSSCRKRDNVEIEPGDRAAGTFTFRGGTTRGDQPPGRGALFDCQTDRGHRGDERLERQRSYLRRMAASFPLAPYVAFDAEGDLGFRGIHRGY